MAVAQEYFAASTSLRGSLGSIGPRLRQFMAAQRSAALPRFCERGSQDPGHAGRPRQVCTCPPHRVFERSLPRHQEQMIDNRKVEVMAAFKREMIEFQPHSVTALRAREEIGDTERRDIVGTPSIVTIKPKKEEF
jgi:hypothetical protein